MKFLRSVIALCSGFASYREFRDLAITTSLKHLLKLVTLLALVVALSAIPTAREAMDWFTHRFDQGRPDFSLHEGKIVTQAQQPASWGDDNLRFILDTTGKVTTPDSNATYGVLFTTDSFLYWMTFTNGPTPVVSTRLQSLSGFPDGAINGDYFHNLSRALLWLLVPLAWLLFVVLGMLSCLIQAYLFAMVASFMERSMPAPLQLSQLLNIAIHACTPAAIVVTVYTAFHLHDLNLWMVYLIVYGFFLIGATNACRDTVEGSRPHEDDLV
jgi:Trk-type K+ transport system membrane component